MNDFKLSFGFACILIICSCVQRTTSVAPSLDGYWLSVGYGSLFHIDGEQFSSADITSISCTPVMEGALSTFEDRMTLEGDTLRLVDGINTYYYTRLDSPPGICTKDRSVEMEHDPVYNFEVLSQTFVDHYAYFELRKVNWDSLYAATKQKITNETSPAELYIIMDDMLDHFNDGHISLDATSEVMEAAQRLRALEAIDIAKQNQKRYGDLVIADMIADHYIVGDRKSTRGKAISWGMLENNIGYLQVNIMFGHADLGLPDSLKGNDHWRAYFGALEEFTSEHHTQLELKGINTTLDKVFKDIGASDAMVLDVRFNGGGKDEVGLELMKRFNADRHLVLTKKGKVGTGFTPINKVYLESSDDPYLSPVFLLTSAQSASATEIMVMSSLQLPHVTRIGGRTEGVFSDVLDKVLPNEWEFGLSSEVYLDTEGNNYEGLGIAPDIDLGYADDVQEFFRSLVDDLGGDKAKVMSVIK